MVGGTPKPFACTSEGCTMTFTNEDHLNVHQRKHEMVLNLGIKTSSIVADQTPTPTRFLRNCEEVGLFQDLQNVNPFEETFRRAVEMVKTGSLPVPDLPEDDTLHTPHVFPHMPEDNVSCIYNAQTLKNIKIDSNTENNLVSSIHLNAHSIHNTTNNKNLTISTDKNESVLTFNRDSPDHIYSLTSMNTDKNPTILINDKPNLALNDTSDHIQVLSSEEKHPSANKKPKFVVREKKISSTKFINKSNVNIKSSNTNITSAKVKLQQILQTKQIKSAENKNVAQSVILVPGLNIANSDKIVSELTMVPVLQTISVPVSAQNTVSSQHSVCPSVTTQNTINSVTLMSKNTLKTNKITSEVTDTRKLDLLARNRAAATRCRQRKRQWIGSLENKYNIVCQEKDDLQKENSILRHEIQQLKGLLLAHKDCQVTKNMNMGQSIPIGSTILTFQVPVNTKEELNENTNAVSQNLEITSVDMKPNISFEKQSKTSVIVYSFK